ncbi:hypothetical protein [Mariniradius sediminis]|uniref:Uncharacterized protein n=1 Tax=Mariniradius sediminis TaxID=2909237 RepID=A0ABS9BVJ8_9BACT|nr:hypothetical protein [Mariniradius sediminis]MCF1751370.1 hypothetical protein [Mariniradius sediminis]
MQHDPLNGWKLAKKGDMDIEQYQYLFGDDFKNERSLEWVIYQYLYYTHHTSREEDSFYARLGREATKARLGMVVDFYQGLRNQINQATLQELIIRKQAIENQLASLRNSNSTGSLPMMYFGELILKKSEVSGLISIKRRHDVLPEIEFFSSLNAQDLMDFLS